jgi:hypothetical protein
MHRFVAALVAALGARWSRPRMPAPPAVRTWPTRSQKVDQTDNYHGTTVADPYRWLEDANSADTKQWVDAQNKVTQGLAGQIPQREAIRQRLTKLWNYERYSVPYKEGGRYFYSRNDGLQNQSVLYTMKSLGDAAHAARPEHPGGRRHGRPGRHRGQPGRQAAGLRHRRLGFGLERVEACATSRPARTWKTTSSGSSSRAPPGPRTARASSTAATTSRRKRPSWPTSTTSRSCTSTRSARRKAPTRWSTTVPTRRNGASAPPPTTAATC